MVVRDCRHAVQGASRPRCQHPLHAECSNLSVALCSIHAHRAPHWLATASVEVRSAGGARCVRDVVHSQGVPLHKHDKRHAARQLDAAMCDAVDLCAVPPAVRTSSVSAYADGCQNMAGFAATQLAILSSPLELHGKNSAVFEQQLLASSFSAADRCSYRCAGTASARFLAAPSLFQALQCSCSPTSKGSQQTWASSLCWATRL